LTDELDVGNAASERDHAYEIVGQSWSGTTTSSYDKYEQGDPYPTADDGRAFTGFSRFTVKIDPRNEGVRLRRRTNRNVAHVQRANVFVDGARLFDTPWCVCDEPAPLQTAFLDTDFEIPAAYTTGKDRITIKVEHVAGLETNSSNEYYYWVYSYGTTPVTPEPPEAPAARSAVDGGVPAVELSWSNLSDEDVENVTIERRRETEPRFRAIAQVGGKATSYRDENVEPLTAYAYRVRAIGEAGPSPWTETWATLGPPPGLRNLALDATASASTSWQESQAPGMANDGRLDTRWNSAMWKFSDQWLTLDFGEETRLDTVLVYQETGWTRISSFAIQGWIDGAWKDVCDGQNMLDVAVLRFAPVRTSKIRLMMYKTTGNTPTIKEFQVFNAAAHDGRPGVRPGIHPGQRRAARMLVK
jgi:hypothetical protein